MDKDLPFEVFSPLDTDSTDDGSDSNSDSSTEGEDLGVTTQQLRMLLVVSMASYLQMLHSFQPV